MHGSRYVRIRGQPRAVHTCNTGNPQINLYNYLRFVVYAQKEFADVAVQTGIC